MRKPIFVLAFVLALATCFAYSQMQRTNPNSSNPNASTPSTFPSGADQGMGQQGTMDQDRTQSQTQPQDKDQTHKAKKEAAPAVDDQTLDRQIKDQLASNPAFSNVTAACKHGNCTLEGSVASKADRKQAADLAKAVPGVKKVKDKLTISASAGTSGATTGGMAGTTAPTTGTTSQQPSSAGSISGNTQAGAGTQTSTGSETSTQTSGAQASSGAMGAGSSTQVTQIQSAIQNESSLANSNITVTVNANQIVLSGTVPSDQERDRAAQIAQANAGSMTVVNNITVSSSGGTGAAAAGTTGGVGGTAAGTASQQGAAGTAGTSGAVGSSTQQQQQGTGAGTAMPQQGTSGAAGTMGASSDLQGQIQTALKNEPTLANDNINVNLTDDTVVLSGTVATGKERQTAKRIAQSFAGNRRVVDRLTVTGRGHGSSSAAPEGNAPQGQEQQPPQGQEQQQPPQEQQPQAPPR